MEFKDFAQNLYAIIGASKGSIEEFTEALFTEIVPESAVNDLINKSPATYRSYYKGSRSIDELAWEISPYIEPELFAKYIADLGDAVVGNIYEVFKNDIPDITPNNTPEKVAYTFNSIIVAATTKRLRKNPIVQAFRADCYQLLVTTDIKGFTEEGTLIFPRNRISPSLLADIDQLRLIPAIICMENTKPSGETDPNQLAVYGYIDAVKNTGTDIVVAFKPIAEFPQNLLCYPRNATYFDLSMLGRVTTLNHSAWTIHNINLFKAFEEAGLSNLPMPK